VAQACSSTAAIAVALSIPGARPPVALAGAASTATVHLHLRMNELRKLFASSVKNFETRLILSVCGDFQVLVFAGLAVDQAAILQIESGAEA
jgi:hypothetical protein